VLEIIVQRKVLWVPPVVHQQQSWILLPLLQLQLLILALIQNLRMHLDIRCSP